MIKKRFYFLMLNPASGNAQVLYTLIPPLPDGEIFAFLSVPASWSCHVSAMRRRMDVDSSVYADPWVGSIPLSRIALVAQAGILGRISISFGTAKGGSNLILYRFVRSEWV